MSASLFHWDWFINPPWERVGLWWLQNYVNEVRTNPRTREAMEKNPAEFEMVPVPKAVLKYMASAADAAGAPEAPRVDSKPLMKVVEQFGKALEAGDVKEAMALVTRQYYDANGRDRKALQKDLTTLVRDLGTISVSTTAPDRVAQVGNQVVAQLSVDFKSDQRRGKASVEVFLGKSGREGWRIESIRTY